MSAAGTGSRRLRLLGWLVVGINLVLAARLVQIQVFEHDSYLSRAERQWKHRIPMPARRGNIYDRNGRPLALSATTWRVGVSTSRVTDPDATAGIVCCNLPSEEIDAAGLARRIRDARGGHLVVARAAALSREALDAFSRRPEITHEQLGDRVYPMGGVGASLIGFHREESDGTVLDTGLEKGLARWLAGEAGEAWEYESAHRGQTLGKEVLRSARDGRDVVLTLDAELQAICEDLLVDAVEECSASGGTALIVDPRDGSVLAAADTPVVRGRGGAGLAPESWDNFNFNGVYEPGSVFKIFTSAALLGRSAITTDTSYDCADNDFGGFRIRNSEGHDYGVMDFTEGFVHSSNVYFARAAFNLRKSELYRDLRAFGFGTRTRFPYPGQAAGLLQEPEKWSGRTLPTMAIGQEIGVTPLQLAMAAAAVANGGRLYAPRVVREVKASATEPGVVEPAVLRGRVIAPELAARLREVMAQVVERGTGVAAAVPWVRVAGKTGTAQKAVPGRGYVPGLYMSSFLAMVPAGEPRLVILTMLDEPDYAHHYASQSAAPLCGRIITEIGRSTDWLDGAGTTARVAADRSEAGGRVPDLLYTSAVKARARLARAGLKAAGDAGDGVVVAQRPTAGTVCAPGTEIELTVAPASVRGRSDGLLCPDLTGLSNREVRRRAAGLGVPIRIEGVGYVNHQQPAPGEPLGAEGMTVRMVARWR